jgi:FlaA1/EpsC-like NDP-sugar epimerase
MGDRLSLSVRGEVEADDHRVGPLRVRIAQFFARIRADLSFAAIDAVIVVLGYTAALVLRFMDITGVAPDWWHSFAIALPVILGVHLVANLLFGAYGHIWEFASVEEAMRVVFAAVASGLILIGGVVGLQAISGSDGRLLPIMVIALGAGLSLAGMGAARFRSRVFSFQRAGQKDPAAAVIVGTGRTAVDLARSSRAADNGVRVVAFVAANGAVPHRRRLAGLPVMGTLADVPAIVTALDVRQVVIAEDIGEDRIRDLVDRCVDIDVGLRVLPELDAVLGNDGSLRDVRDLELGDLLPRPPVATDLEDVAALLSDKRVLVTGAGGSIGSELIRQICDFEPAAVYALDHDETHLFDAVLDFPVDGLRPTEILADIRDADLMKRVFSQIRPQVVFHAAAHKHVPILESYPDEAIRTNVLGTANVIAATQSSGVERFVLISTDKAVDPSSMMGASKRVAEMLTQSAAATSRGPIFAAVRFGNVLGSRGSVVPTFMRQIKAGGPVTVSDPSMLRYFMTIGEAVQLVLQASSLARGGEVFVLDMGEPVLISDLARRMIRLAGLVPGRDVAIVVTGTRPGEKHTEILSRSKLLPSAHPKIQLDQPSYPGPATLLDALSTLAYAANAGDRNAAGEMLHTIARQIWATDEVVNLTDSSTVGTPNRVA